MSDIVSWLDQFDLDEYTRRHFYQFHTEMVAKGWSRSDVQLFLSATEEISPELEEDIALKIMNRIRNKYKG